jgi:hypothetical protein
MLLMRYTAPPLAHRTAVQQGIPAGTAPPAWSRQLRRRLGCRSQPATCLRRQWTRGGLCGCIAAIHVRPQAGTCVLRLVRPAFLLLLVQQAAYETGRRQKCSRIAAQEVGSSMQAGGEAGAIPWQRDEAARAHRLPALPQLLAGCLSRRETRRGTQLPGTACNRHQGWKAGEPISCHADTSCRSTQRQRSAIHSDSSL